MKTIVTKFKETEIGIIPEEWDVVKLGDLIEKIVDNRGKTPPLVQSGYELLEVNSIKAGNRSPDYSEVEKFVDEQTHKSWFRTGHIMKNDLIIPTVGTIGNLAIAPDNRGSIAQNLIALRIKQENDPNYLYYLLSSANYKEKLFNLDIGGVQPSIKVPHLMNLEIPLPKYNEQKQIAEILSSLDDKIELNRKINENLEKLISDIFKEWFVDIIVELPRGKFGDLVEITSGKRPEEKNDTMTEDFIIPLLGASSTMGYVKEYLYNEQILVTGRVGTHGIIQKVDYPCWPSDNTLVIKSKFLEFAYQVMKDFDFSSLNRGSTQPLITQGDLKNIEIGIPEKTMLEKFEEMTAPFVKRARNNNEENQNISKIRDSLLPRLMSGKIRTKI